MKRETPDEKWSRLQNNVQDGILKAYPNPDRKGCPGRDGVIELARRAAKFDDAIEDDPKWRHVTHCQPCYREYLDEFRTHQHRKPPASST
jgi:hypothetical protein